MLRLTRFPRWKKGYPVGTRPNLGEAMQFEADQQRYNRIMERLSVPEKRDSSVSLLLDLSGSMAQGDRIIESFKALVLLTEVLSQLDVPHEILGFAELPQHDNDRQQWE